MNVCTATSLIVLIISFSGLAESRRNGRSSPGNGKLPNKCEVYTGTTCSKYLSNVTIFVKPFKPQNQEDIKLKMAFRVLPGYLSKKCAKYAYAALCLRVFPPCDQTVNYPKAREFCREECNALTQEICAEELNNPRALLLGHATSCSNLPPVNSPEHKKCIRLNVTIEKPIFKLKLKNETALVDETVVLKCKIKPVKIPPKITWYKDGKNIQPGDPWYKIHLFRLGSRMKIRRVRPEDSGKYKCEVKNFAWTVSSESWITVTGSGKNSSRCGYLKPGSICTPYLKDQYVYLRDEQKQHQSESLIHLAIKNFNGSSKCSGLVISAMCHHFFRKCVGRFVKHTLCKEDCQKVRKDCPNMVPSTFPRCHKLPKITGKKGRHCQALEYDPNVDHKSCGRYKGNGFCAKYLPNDTIYFDDIQQQYNMERALSIGLKKDEISPECFKFGVPAVCYHLFPACDQGIRKSRLCKGECVKLKTDFCSMEVSMIEQLRLRKSLFPECSNLPNAGSKNSKYCIPLQNPAGPTSATTEMDDRVSYDSSHKCYNGTGADYKGTHNISVHGIPCLSWRIPRPDSGWSHNYCRNPMGEEKSPWCYVDKEKKEYCAIPKCPSVGKDPERLTGNDTSLGRTIYVVIAIVAVILLGCVTVVVYWKVQNSKENHDRSPQGSAAPFAKCSSTQLNDIKEITDVKSIIMKERMNRGKVKCISRMWKGNFCQVYKGELVNDPENSNMNIVIKALCEGASEMDKDAFDKETSFLGHLQHVNILGLLGISPNEDFVVFEYLSETNLHEFLVEPRSAQNGSDEDNSPATELLLGIATQIANGMKYLTDYNYVHGDLAARNCFISENGLSVKVSLLGMGNCKYPSDYHYLQGGSSLFPIRWMSPESLESTTLTSENDVWAFGVTLWEIFSLGLKPYHHYNNMEAAEKIRAHELLECSQDWPQFLRHLMNECWSVVPSTRPNFDKIYETLSIQYTILAEDALEVKL